MNPRYEYGPGPAPVVKHANTRFSSAGEENGSSSSDGAAQILDAAAGQRAIARLAAAAHGTPSEVVDALRGYQLVATPSPCVGGNPSTSAVPLDAADGASYAGGSSVGGGGGWRRQASPLITWGAVIGTPMRLNETEYGHASRMHQPFKVPALPPRDAKLPKARKRRGGAAARADARRTRQGSGGSATPNLPLARPASSGGKAGTPQLSAAASKMAKSLRSSMAASPAIRVCVRRTRRSRPPPSRPQAVCYGRELARTPKPTPRPTPTPGGGGAAQRRPTANAASARRASSMTGGATPSASAAMGEAAAGSAAGGGGAAVTDGLLKL